MIKNNRSSSSINQRQNQRESSLHSSNGGYSNRLKKYQNQNVNFKHLQSSYHQSQYAIHNYSNNAPNSQSQKNSRIIKQSNSNINNNHNPHNSNSRVNTSMMNPAQSHVQKWGSNNNNIDANLNNIKVQGIHAQSQASQLRRSQKSEVNSQIDTLNRLRQEYQILKQIISQDQAMQLTSKMSNNSKSKQFRNYSQQSQAQQLYRQKHQKDNIKQNSNNNTHQDIQMLKSLLHRTKDYYHGQKDGLIEKQSIQIIQLQNALQQSSIKISQLLTELSENKELVIKMKENISNQQNLKMQFKLLSEAQMMLKKQIQQKNTKINQIQMKNKFMQQTIQTYEVQAKLKDREINALQKANIEYRGKSPIVQELQLTKSNFKNLENQYKQKMAEVNQLRQKNLAQVRQNQSRIQQSRLYFQQMRKSQVNQQQKTKFQLQGKLRQLQKVLQSQNRQKQSFIGDITNMKLSHKNMQAKYEQVTKQKDQIIQKNKQLVQKLQKVEQKLTKYKNQKLQLQSMKNSLIKQFQQSNRQSMWKQQKSRQVQENLSQIKQNYKLLENQYKSTLSKLKHAQAQLSQLEQKNRFIQEEFEHVSKQLEFQKQCSSSLKAEVDNQALKLIEMFSLTQTNKAMQERINSMMETSHQTDKKINSRQAQLTLLALQHKKQINKYKEQIQRFGILATQNKLQNCHIVNSYQEKNRQLMEDIDQKIKDNKLIQQQMKNQRNSLVNQLQDSKEKFNSQIKDLANKLFGIVQEKQLLQKQIQHYMRMQAQFRMTTRQLKTSRTLTQSIDHLWKIKQAQYSNIDEILNNVARHS